MELKQLIIERRSIHAFENRSVSPSIVEELLDSAVWVPNHRLTQPWRFILVHREGRGLIGQAGRAFAERMEKEPAKKQEAGQRLYDKLMAIPMFLVVVMAENPHPLIREEDYAATSCVIHNLSLLAWEKGIGMVWETYPLIHDPGFREALSIRPGEKVIGSLHLGYPLKFPIAQPRISAGDRITIFDQGL
ncbi:MAG: nitroreductase [Gorillibacterium sp.]|nr:nitroreductase [Gorillibacterium sp.]